MVRRWAVPVSAHVKRERALGDTHKRIEENLNRPVQYPQREREQKRVLW